ncbi:MAG: hypothetical protein KAS39_00035, partial [Actinomycetia bacterium]|nr:hypothetical protein [Actinomycetes bacterium]
MFCKIENSPELNEKITIPSARHLNRVLRLKPGDILLLKPDHGDKRYYYSAVVEKITDHIIELIAREKVRKEYTVEKEIILFSAIPKKKR